MNDDISGERIKLTDLIKNKVDEDTFEGKYNASIRRRILFILAVLVSVFVLSLFAVGLGAVDIPVIDTFRVFLNPVLPSFVGEPSQSYYSDFILMGRLPRLLLIVLTGFALGTAGMIMQGLLRNPLVSPFTLGISTAAAFGAAMAIVLGPIFFGETLNMVVNLGFTKFPFSDFTRVLFAFAFSMICIFLVLMLTRDKGVSRSLVILAGVVISYLFQAGISAAKYFSDDHQLREITLWLMGTMSGATWGTIVILIPIVVICSIYLFKMSLDINTLAAGDDVASSLGVNVPRLRRRGLIICTLMVSACLAFTGVIGFIGLMAPHICRIIIGNDPRYLMPASALMGILILMVSDLFSRLIIKPGELPVGIVLYIVGGIFFIWMISNKKWSQRV